jgi:hypothetical protein
MASHLRFPPHEYRALCHAARRVDLGGRPNSVRRLLAAALAGDHPELAGRICRLRGTGLLVLLGHLRGAPPERQADLTPPELRMLAEAYGPLLLQARFLVPLWRDLVRQLREVSPDLAAKLDRLSRTQVEALCRSVTGRA